MTEQPESYVNEEGHTIWHLPSKGKDYYHRKNGPAVELSYGTKAWWADGKRHRLDGPAIEHVDGAEAWFINGNRLPTEEVETWLEENNIDLKTDEGQMAFKLRWT